MIEGVLGMKPRTLPLSPTLTVFMLMVASMELWCMCTLWDVGWLSLGGQQGALVNVLTVEWLV